jgi:hypothetical protein
MVVGPRDSRFCSRSLTLVRVHHCRGTGHPLNKDFPNRKLAWGAATDGAAMGNRTGPSVAAPALAQALLRAAQPRLRVKQRLLRAEALTGAGEKKILCPTIEVHVSEMDAESGALCRRFLRPSQGARFGSSCLSPLPPLSPC